MCTVVPSFETPHSEGPQMHAVHMHVPDTSFEIPGTPLKDHLRLAPKGGLSKEDYCMYIVHSPSGQLN